MRPRLIAVFAALLVAASVAFAPAAEAKTKVQKLHFEYGTVHIRPGQNIIEFSGGQVPKPTVPGWVTSIKPNLYLPDGSVPPVDIIHLHHTVWINLSHQDATSPGLPERFFAAGEEKTELRLPKGYGYPVQPSDNWLLNYMIHDLVNTPYDVRIAYDIEFVPATTDKPLTNVVPWWMDVQNGQVYPVFDVHRGSGGDGKFTYPDEAVNPYNGGPAKNVFTVPQAGKLVWAGGHLHPGGLYDDLFVDRGGQSAHVFRSDAKYFEPAGPVSWDVSLKVTGTKWNVGLQPGDKLRISSTYDSSSWAWFETMGIMMLWFAPNEQGTDPFALTNKQKNGKLTHGHLKENNNHGGGFDANYVDMSALPNGPATSAVNIFHGQYTPGNMKGAISTPTVAAGQKITFTNSDAPPSGYGTWHTITACKLPCNRSTGVAYPTADSLVEFDSGQLGNYGEPTTGGLTWDTPTNIPVGTYTYFCRTHPGMRGGFRVVPPAP